MTFFQNKVIVIGNPQVGKTSLIQRVIANKFSYDYKPTIGVDFSVKTVKLLKNDTEHIFKLQLWDISGQEQFNAMSRSYYRNSQGCLLVADLSEKDVVGQITPWLTSVKESCPNIPVILAMNKCDKLESQNNLNDTDFTEELGKLELGDHLHVSSLDGTNVEKLMNLLCVRLLEFNTAEQRMMDQITKQSLHEVANKIEPAAEVTKKQGCC